MSTVGCGDAQTTGELSSYDATLDLTWKPCAKEGEHCAFSGVQAVRYGAHDEFLVKTAENGTHCIAERFGTTSLPDAHCEIADEAALDAELFETAHAHTDQAEAEMDAEHAHAAVHEPAADIEHAHTADPETATADQDSEHAGHAPIAKLDLSALPRGEPGSDSVDLGTSAEKPTRSDGVGAFRTVCDYSHMNYDDPIVFPGQPGKAHLHAYFGNVSADAMSTVESIRDTGRSTCRGGTANRTAYWVPAVIDANGEAVKPTSLDTYYKSGYNGVSPGEVQPFPSGLRMIAGDMKSTSPQAKAYWGCRENYIGHPGSIPNNCPSGDHVVMMVEFPQCWDGKNLDSADHKSHMAYPSNGGGCPASHPVAIPAITMNVLYDVPAGGTAGWRLSSDGYDRSKPGGMSAHADWFEGWDPEIVETFVEKCINPGVDCHSHLLGDGRTIR